MAERESTAGAGVALLARPAELKARILERLRGTTPSALLYDWREGRTRPANLIPASDSGLAALVPAAVLVPLIERAAGLTVLLTQRATHLKNHAGQISFPGGRIELSDGSALAAALREAQEEIGLDPREVTPVGYLPDHQVTRYRVTPVVAFIAPSFSARHDRSEVDETFEVPLSYVLDPGNHKSVRRRLGERDVDTFDIPYGAHNIWGGTARMLLTFREIVLDQFP